ncbi:MAG: hypothetical protein KGJ06_00875 [Pseudomonadota bacterium]|nr:hypothetical protein [Pseudomonadota bacterium]
MPRLVDDNMEQHRIAGGNFGFTGARIDHLGATEYTLVDIDVDVTGSVCDFADELRKMLVTAVTACKKSPRSDNLLVRVALFSTSLGIRELHGFKPLSEINPDDYPQFDPCGGTNLFDANYTGIGALVDYGSQLATNDFLVNAIHFGITDGDNNSSLATPRMIAQKVAEARKGEKLESILTILIGINADGMADPYGPNAGKTISQLLEEYKADAELDRYINAGDATPGKLAKLAAFVSRSVSSQSQALGTGGPSQQIDPTI